MVRPPARSTLTLPSLIGVRVADAPCVLRADQLLRIAALLLQSRPQDARAICFLGGPLAELSGARSDQQVVALEGDLGTDPFLVISGPQGAVALLAAETAQGFAARLLTVPDTIDRAALVLSQFSDHSYSLDALSEPEAQRGFVATALMALTAAPDLAGVDLRALAPDERRWLDLAYAGAAAPSPGGLLGLPAVRALLQEHGVGKVVVGALDAGLTQLQPLVTSDATFFPLLRSLPALLTGVARTQRGGSATATDIADLPGELRQWVAGQALTVVPVTEHGFSIGLVMAASERPLNSVGRAMLNGLAVLLKPVLRVPNAPSPPTVVAAPPDSPQPRAVGAGMQGLAARLAAQPRPSGAAPAPRPAAPPTPSAAPSSTMPVSAAVASAQLPSVHEGECSEAFLTNFANIIRMPLRELRELITQVPAAGSLNEQQSRLIGQVVRLNSELTMLVNELLALGQIRLQTLEARIPLRLDLLVEAAVDTQYAEFGRRGQHVTTEIQPGLPRIAGSEEGLGRAVGALIDNAIKYSPAGAQISVGVAAQNNEVLVSVQDNGVGLLPEELAQIFAPFYRAPSTEPLGVAGRGLGLTIAKAVIEQHGGRIWAAGAPGQGCTFSFSLPRE